MGRELQVILGVQVWQRISEIQLLVHNEGLRRYVQKIITEDFYAVAQRSPRRHSTGPIKTNKSGGVPAGLGSRLHCGLRSGWEWWRWGAGQTSRSKKFCVWPLLPGFGPCASERTTVRQVSGLLWCTTAWKWQENQKNWNTNLEATKGQEKVSSRCQTTPLGQEDDCGGRSNPKRTLRRNETILGFLRLPQSWKGRVEGEGGVDAKNPRLNQTSVESQSFKSTAPLIYRLGGPFWVTSCLYLLASCWYKARLPVAAPDNITKPNAHIYCVWMQELYKSH